MSTSEPLNVTGSSGVSSKDLVDLEALVINWAKQIFEVTKTKAEARISKKYLQFKTLEQFNCELKQFYSWLLTTAGLFTCRISSLQKPPDNKYNINWSHLFNESLEPVYSVAGVDTKQVRQAKEEQCLFKSTFTNTTEREQEYSFKTERSTRSTATVVVEKGVCRGVEMALKLKTPGEVVEANAGFHNEVSVMHIGENTTEEELIWGVDSTVRVPPLCETVAELVILEEHHTRSFTIEGRLSGKVIVTVTNLHDNNSLVTIIEGKIADIIRGTPNYPAMGFVVTHDVATYTTKGTCKFKYGVEQKVRITEHAVRRPY